MSYIYTHAELLLYEMNVESVLGSFMCLPTALYWKMHESGWLQRKLRKEAFPWPKYHLTRLINAVLSCAVSPSCRWTPKHHSYRTPRCWEEMYNDTVGSERFCMQDKKQGNWNLIDTHRKRTDTDEWMMMDRWMLALHQWLRMSVFLRIKNQGW